MSHFFVSCAIGFEHELAHELKMFWFEMMDLDGQPTRSVLADYEIQEGGIEIETAEHLGFQINLFSKLANRVLLRIHHFEARYFDQFEKEFKKLDLEKWLEPQNLILKIETHKSRINNQKSIEESLTALLKNKKFIVVTEGVTDEKAPGQTAPQMLYIRNEKDRVTISLDTSGLHLHKRGYGLYRGEAPLREVFAAFLLRQLEKHAVTLSDLTLIDPFVGSGTILFEAQCAKFPLFRRDYAWLHFKNRPKLFKSDTWRRNYNWFRPSPGLTCYGIDHDAKAVENLEKNQKIFNEIFPLADSRIHAVCADSLTVDLSAMGTCRNAWVVTNPPYGRRLHEGQAVEILERFESELDLKGLIVLHPETWNLKFRKIKLVSRLDFKNQGLKLKLSVYSL